MTQQMKWEDLLCRDRFSDDSGSEADPEKARSIFQRDYDRIIFSSAFRRMQDKTQVFPLAESDYIRTRLTHSLEVASVGRSLGKIVGGRIISSKAPYLTEPQLDYVAEDFGAIVSAACIAHDIGNPPFGHSGEAAISYWFENSPLIKKLNLTDAQRADLLKFEGNAQGFRVITRLQNLYPSGGMRLSYATLGAFTKYPRQSLVTRASENGEVQVSGDELKKRISSKKFGFFQKDKESFLDIAKKLKLIPIDGSTYWWCRHPLAYLVEAADDICYNVIDLEDGFKLNYLTFEETHNLLNPLLREPLDAVPRLLSKHDKQNHISFMRSKAIDNLIRLCGDVFMKNYDEIMAGWLASDLLSLTKLEAPLERISEASRQKLYRANSVLQIEITGFELIGELLDGFANAVFHSDSRSKKYVDLLDVHSINYNNSDADYAKLLQVTDFIAGMTDTYAMEFYRKIKGIRLAGYPA